MTILLVSADEEAVRLLRSSLSRAGQIAHWETCVGAARLRIEEQPPLVVVADADLPEHAALIDAARAEAPWTRVCLIGAEYGGERAIHTAKPFDAAELAEQLTRQQELATRDRDRYALELELEHSERLAAIGRIAARMAHEINNPLAVIRASADYMSRMAKRNGEADLTDCVLDIQLAVERIGDFMQHVVGFARRGRPQLTDAALGQTIDMSFRMVRPRAKDRKVDLSLELPETIHVAHDPPRLSQAVINLLANAVDAAALGAGHVYLRVIEEPEQIRIQVDDDGPGVDPQLEAHIFEPFATTKPYGQGTGLGLAIARQIVHDHHGTIDVSRRPEGGTRAEIVLPAMTPGSSAESRSVGAPAATARQDRQ